MVRIRSGAVAAAAAGPAGDWTRPADWLELPAVTAGQQKMVGLVAVWPGDSNWVSIRVTGAYVVDWGDGSAPENVASNTQVDHNILWANVAAGTLTTLGYRQAVVTVTMQGAETMTVLSLQVDTVNTTNNSTSLWLDITMASANLTSLTVSGSTVASASLLQRFEYVGSSSITSTAPKFSNATALREIVGTAWTSGCTSFSSTFASCFSLTTTPTLDTSAGTNFSTMFNGCSSLTRVEAGAMDTVAGTNFSNMFLGCSALATVAAGALDTSAGTNFTSMFSGCITLIAIPPLVVSAATTGYPTMFSSCISLRVGTMSGTKLTISYASCALSATELDAIYTGLATVVGQTITVSSNWGAAGDTPSLATDKGWTLVG